MLLSPYWKDSMNKTVNFSVVLPHRRWNKIFDNFLNWRIWYSLCVCVCVCVCVKHNTVIMWWTGDEAWKKTTFSQTGSWYYLKVNLLHSPWHWSEVCEAHNEGLFCKHNLVLFTTFQFIYFCISCHDVEAIRNNLKINHNAIF